MRKLSTCYLRPREMFAFRRNNMSVVWTESLQHSDGEKFLLETIHTIYSLNLTEANIAITHTNNTY